jgi:hypothetical protein
MLNTTAVQYDQLGGNNAQAMDMMIGVRFQAETRNISPFCRYRLALGNTQPPT